MVLKNCEYYWNLTKGISPGLTEDEKWFYLYYYSLMFIITLVSIVGNSFILIVYARHQKLRSPSNHSIATLAFADLSSTILYSLYNISHMEIPEIQMELGKYIFLHPGI